METKNHWVFRVLKTLIKPSGFMKDAQGFISYNYGQSSRVLHNTTQLVGEMMHISAQPGVEARTIPWR
jgi:hypothetical protein